MNIVFALVRCGVYKTKADSKGQSYYKRRSINLTSHNNKIIHIM